MGSRGPLPKPTSVRSLNGTYADRRTLADVPADQLGKATMPKWLDKDARTFWRRHAPDLEAAGLLTALDQDAFALLCAAWSRLQQLEAQIAEDGELVTGPRGGLRPHPLTSPRNKTYQSVQAGLAAFGMTPASRQRIHVTPPRPSAPIDDFDAWERRRLQLADDPRNVLRDDTPAS